MTTKENYLKNPDFDQKKFYKMYQTMFTDDRIMDDIRGGHAAVVLYGGIANKISLSRSTHINEGDTSFINSDGQYYCVFPVKTARAELKIKRTKYGHHKALLRDAGLIHYEPQEEKKEGDASRITYTPWDIWVKQNGLYSDGKWIVPPSTEHFYNPTDIVTVQPTIKGVNDNENTEETIRTIAQDKIAEYEELMNKVKYMGIEFHKAGRMDELLAIVKSYFGRNKKLTEAKIHDLPKIRDTYKVLETTFKEGSLPNFF
ncbi:hypothetical protein MKY89_26115 [Bacillus sp. FSL W7-1294]|uniref:hypothetical protein n=1 Tax=Bacillus TaxID=1386 RepID=UPI00077A9763|nr:hypothetical protein [Bacillus cereus]KXY76763.1 hypothetical protein AT270_10745 [Bacillus cereus]